MQVSTVEAPTSEELSQASLLTGIRSPWRLAAMSPLRYPGSKRKMMPAIRQLIEGNIPRPELFVEPFCGGASVSLGLLEMDAVERVVLGDLDPLIASFWIEATENAERLIDDMIREPVTVERWDYWRAVKPGDTRHRALKCLFLNRTTFFGIIGGNAGPICGRNQASAHLIDCRFSKDALAERILNVKRLADSGRILKVHEARWQETISLVLSCAADHQQNEVMFYLDPPYIEKAKRLYEQPFVEADHRALAHRLLDFHEHRWILSYDSERLVTDLYRGKPNVREFRVVHTYTMTGCRSNPLPGREILFSNLPNDPTSSLSTTKGNN